MAEELFTTAPARVIDKQDKNFEPQWHALTCARVLYGHARLKCGVFAAP
ncbi:hypothetical protein TR631_38175 [Streptomyces rochei]|nr:hypothetical protein [Streptomyces rochei]WQC10331.1 hypothetical protein TR631_00135 [Streptomyces rochei]WQC17345.1 hypothetical protein TR631_38175 [Streptomyces rochei]